MKVLSNVIVTAFGPALLTVLAGPWALTGVVAAAAAATSTARGRGLRGEVTSGSSTAMAIEIPTDHDHDHDHDHDGGRMAASCGTTVPSCLSTPPNLVLCSEAAFAANRCETETSPEDYWSLPPNEYRETYDSDLPYPAVMLLAPLQECASLIGVVKYVLLKDGVEIRRYGEKEWPYTVFGDTTNPFGVNSRNLGAGVYQLSAEFKDKNGCSLLKKTYYFQITQCACSHCGN